LHRIDCQAAALESRNNLTYQAPFDGVGFQKYKGSFAVRGVCHAVRLPLRHQLTEHRSCSTHHIKRPGN
jgi:hypothetical protein